MTLCIILLSLTPIVPVLTDEDFPVTVRDGFNRIVVIPVQPHRIASLAPAVTEMLFALGLENEIVGVTSYCNYPPSVVEKVDAGKITVIGGFTNPDPEKILSLDPDLIVAQSTLQQEVITFLEAEGVAIVGLNPKNVEDVIADIALVGRACGKTAEAQVLVDSLNRRMAFVEDRVSRSSSLPRVYYELWYDPLMSVGQGTWIHELLTRAGGLNIFEDSVTPYPTVSPEAVITRNPEIIVIPKGYMSGTPATDLEQRQGWSSIDAIENRRIYQVDEDQFNRPGPRIIDALEQIAVICHPELFTGRIDYMRGISFDTNSILLGAHYDSGRKMLNFTLTGEEGSQATIKVEIDQNLLDGAPVVFLDDKLIATTLSDNGTAYTILFMVTHSSHSILVAGANTIPEFSFLILLLALSLALAGAISLKRTGGRSSNSLPEPT
ncbi:ABC transporter substrate-binding protein [[Eubacterium] cellulosolvens]